MCIYIYMYIHMYTHITGIAHLGGLAGEAVQHNIV